MEVVTQVSTSFFSTNSLPASISVSRPSEATSPPAIQPTASLQLDKDTLLSLKQSFVLQDSPSSSADLLPSISTSNDGLAPSSGTFPIIESSFETVQSADISSSQLPGNEDKPDYLNNENGETPLTNLNLPSFAGVVTRPPVAAAEAVAAIIAADPELPSAEEEVAEESPVSSEANYVGGLAAESPVAGSSNTGSVAGITSDNVVAPEQLTATSPPPTSGDNAFTNGLLGAVVGGISNALIPKPPAGSAGAVDLGPVLDAVATLLRGPIRNAIANRRQTSAAAAAALADRTDTKVEPTRTASVPKFAWLPSNDPNVKSDMQDVNTTKTCQHSHQDVKGTVSRDFL